MWYYHITFRNPNWIFVNIDAGVVKDHLEVVAEGLDGAAHHPVLAVTVEVPATLWHAAVIYAASTYTNCQSLREKINCCLKWESKSCFTSPVHWRKDKSTVTGMVIHLRIWSLFMREYITVRLETACSMENFPSGTISFQGISRTGFTISCCIITMSPAACCLC